MRYAPRISSRSRSCGRGIALAVTLCLTFVAPPATTTTLTSAATTSLPRSMRCPTERSTGRPP